MRHRIAGKCAMVRVFGDGTMTRRKARIKGGPVQYHRPLVQEDVETAHRLLTMHQPTAPDAHDRSYCASATHYTPALWPCARHRWRNAATASRLRTGAGGVP